MSILGTNNVSILCDIQEKNFGDQVVDGNVQTFTHGNLTSSKRSCRFLKAFCQNKIHYGKHKDMTGSRKYYVVKGLKGVAFERVKGTTKDSIECSCGMALFWSRNYAQFDIDEIQDFARRLNDLPTYNIDFVNQLSKDRSYRVDVKLMEEQKRFILPRDKRS